MTSSPPLLAQPRITLVVASTVDRAMVADKLGIQAFSSAVPVRPLAAPSYCASVSTPGCMAIYGAGCGCRCVMASTTIPSSQQQHQRVQQQQQLWNTWCPRDRPPTLVGRQPRAAAAAVAELESQPKYPLWSTRTSARPSLSALRGPLKAPRRHLPAPFSRSYCERAGPGQPGQYCGHLARWSPHTAAAALLSRLPTSE